MVAHCCVKMLARYNYLCTLFSTLQTFRSESGARVHFKLAEGAEVTYMDSNHVVI
jgi:hypothetical protein